MKLDLPLDAMLFDRSEQHEAFFRIGIEKTSSKIPFLFIISLTHENGHFVYSKDLELSIFAGI
jgi:hypothetical protein